MNTATFAVTNFDLFKNKIKRAKKEQKLAESGILLDVAGQDEAVPEVQRVRSEDLKREREGL